MWELNVGIVSNLLTAYIRFFLQGDLARTYGPRIPIVLVTEYRSVFVAVAVRAIIFIPLGSIVRTSPI